MNDVERSAMEQALEALKCVDLQSLVPDYGSGHYSVARLDGPQVKSAITALRAALAEPVQEPVADRAAFERHAERLGYSVDPDTRKGRDGGYWSSHTQLMWLTWQAALAEPQSSTLFGWIRPRRYGGGFLPGD